jgi:hypothetical protein
MNERVAFPSRYVAIARDEFQYTNDLDKAGELLAEAGYPGGGFDLLMTYNVSDLDQKQVDEMWSLSTNCGGSRKVWGKTKLFSRKLR